MQDDPSDDFLDDLDLCRAAQFSDKADDVVEQQFRGEKAAHLFKCFAAFCSFTTDSAADFLAHLEGAHGSQGCWVAET